MDEVEYLDRRYNEIINKARISIDEKREWLNKIEKKPGVYIIEIDEKIVYVGETGNLHKRMKDLLKTYNHTFRRSLGKQRFSNDKDYTIANSSKKYSESIEMKLNELMFKECKVSFLSLKLGRKELEEMIQEKLSDQLLNVRRKRK